MNLLSSYYHEKNFPILKIKQEICVKIYIYIIENYRKFYYPWLFAENIAPFMVCSEILGLCTECVAFLTRNLVQIRFRVRICESTSLCTRGCM